ncbi:DUF4388 domain-containing protein [Fischerella sp. JS2]|uniref:DUF4388 domain-containing protein n=1 Tax=Fischerella sp. JS2 TaxID=2597771 RepID=UPI0028E93BDE|nr:DUF4388 domain-containing protein [Fischerella sp. JS2]
MSLHSSLADFSLAELFQIIDQGRRSGCLIVCKLSDENTSAAKSRYYFIWFRQGRIVAAANCLDGQGLIGKIRQRKWVQPQVIDKFYTNTETGTPLGLCLKTAGLLNAKQLNLLFASQLQQIRELFEIQKGVFKLDSKAPVPSKEMTGLSVRAIEVALMALRTLKNWNALADAVPNTSSAMCSIIQNKPHLHLKPLEWQIWEFANGSISLSAIAHQLNQPPALVQQAAFRLMIAGLVEEVPLSSSILELKNYPLDVNEVNSSSLAKTKFTQPETFKINTSFLQNLCGYLKSNIS